MVLGRHEVLRQLAAHLLRRVAQQALDGRRDVAAGAVQADAGDDIAHVVGQQPVARFAAPGPGHLDHLVGDILEHADDRGCLTGRRQLADRLGEHMAHLAIGPRQPHLEGEVLLMAQRAFDKASHGRLVFSHKEGDAGIDVRVETGAIDAVDAVDLVGPVGDAVGGDPPMADPGHRLGHGQQALALFRGADRPADLELVHHHAGQQPQAARLLGVQRRPRLGVDQAQRPKTVAPRRRQGRAGIEADVRRPGHQGIGGEARIGRGVGNHQHGVRTAADRVIAERPAARRLARVEPVVRLEPLALLVHQRDQRDRHAEKLGGERGDAVEATLGLGVQDLIGPERDQPVGFDTVQHGLRESRHPRRRDRTRG